MLLPPLSQTVVKMKFGSHLYGTNTPESDTDYKGVFMPSPKDIMLGTIPKSINNAQRKAEGQKNTKDDVDEEFYSLHYFIELALKGETAALDMLHAPDNMTTHTSSWWIELQQNRAKFYTKNLKSFVGYARGQAAKYGLKGSRLNVAQEVANILSNSDGFLTLDTVWDTLPENEHARFIEDNANGVKQYSICGKILQSSQKVQYAYTILRGFVDKFGERARMAANNEGIDWKAMSHALRAAYQVKSILQHGTIQYPLMEARYLLNVKKGELDFLTNVMPELEYVMDIVEDLSQKSSLPEKPDYIFWKNWLHKAVHGHIKAII